MRTLAAIAVLVAGLAAQKPIELVAQDMRTWSVVQTWLEKPLVVKNTNSFSIVNPSFTRDSYVRLRSQAFPVTAKVGNEPDARLRVAYTAGSNIAKTETTWVEIRDNASGAILATRAIGTTTERPSIICKVPKGNGSTIPPVTVCHVQWVVRLNPRQSWTCTKLQAQRTWGPAVQYEADRHSVWVGIASSGFGGNKLGAYWSPTTLPKGIPLPGFAGAGLWVGQGIFFAYPLQPIISRDTTLIAAIRSGSWQALETFPVVAIGFPIGG